MLTVCCDDGSAAGQALDTVYEDHAAYVDGLLNEVARDREVDEQVRVVDVLDTDAEVADARGWVVGRYGLGSNGDNVRNTSIREGSRRDGSVNPDIKVVFLLEKSCHKKRCTSTPTFPSRACPL